MSKAVWVAAASSAAFDASSASAAFSSQGPSTIHGHGSNARAKAVLNNVASQVMQLCVYVRNVVEECL